MNNEEQKKKEEEERKQRTINNAKRFVYKSCADGNLKHTVRFIQKGFPPDTPLNEVQQTMLMTLAMNGNSQGFQMLTDGELDEVNFTPAKWDIRDSMGRTALHYLVQSDVTGEVLQWLLDKRSEEFVIDVDAMTNGGVTPMMLAVKLNREQVVEILVNGSANPFL